MCTSGNARSLRPRAGIIGQVGREGVWNTEEGLALSPSGFWEQVSETRTQGHLYLQPSLLLCFPESLTSSSPQQACSGNGRSQQRTVMFWISPGICLLMGMREADSGSCAIQSTQRLCGPGVAAYAHPPTTRGSEAGELVLFKTSLDRRVKLFQNK